MALAIPIGKRLAALYADPGMRLGGLSGLSSPFCFCEHCWSLEANWDMESHTIMGVIQQCVVYDLVQLGGHADTFPPEVDLSLGLARNTADGLKLLPLTEWSIRLGLDTDDDDDEGDWWGQVKRTTRLQEPLIARYYNIPVGLLSNLVIREYLVGTPHPELLAEVE